MRSRLPEVGGAGDTTALRTPALRVFASMESTGVPQRRSASAAARFSRSSASLLSSAALRLAANASFSRLALSTARLSAWFSPSKRHLGAPRLNSMSHSASEVRGGRSPGRPWMTGERSPAKPSEKKESFLLLPAGVKSKAASGACQSAFGDMACTVGARPLVTAGPPETSSAGRARKCRDGDACRSFPWPLWLPKSTVPAASSG
mmetsp:Transcript_88000/g.145625  ORF Transcript_88000/g.145625 Transcript_88000/m.145625 type:complete len:205 (-) Transcript_88000:235-849(-)